MIKKVNRKKSRKLLFQKLYSMSFNYLEHNSFKESFYENVFTFTVDENYIKEMIKIITFNEKFFIYVLKINSPKFKIETMSLSYILPIYIGLAEMFFLTEDVPGKVSINEAVEVSKVYGDDSSKKVVNGVLNKVYENYIELNKIKNDEFSNINGSCFKN